MAIMIPGKCLDYEKVSQEDVIYRVLEKYCPDNWYVCHSFKIKDVDSKNQSFESEIDFLVLIPDVGAICLESKAGQVNILTGTGLKYNGYNTDFLWVYGDGTVMKYNGPFRQIDRAKRNFEKFLKEGRAKKFGYDGKIDLLSVVCFPSIDSNTIDNWVLPADAGNKKYILSKIDFIDHDEQIADKLISTIKYQIDVEYTNKNKTFHRLNKNECEYFIRDVVAPLCNLVPSSHFFVDLQNKRISSFLKDQTAILNYLEEQKVAVISGGAGTGKTMIAIEKAIRLANEEEKVLYICYNSKLCEFLEKSYEDYPLITFKDIDKLYYDYMGTIQNKNYNLLVKKIENDSTFDFKNFLIDEAQDFGKPEIEASGFLLSLQLMAENKGGVCYYFFDKYQCVQAKKPPEVISKADCKLTLFKNCRNTDKIAKSSCTLFSEEEFKKKYIKGFELGNDVVAVCTSKEKNFEILTNFIREYKKYNYKDIVILTVKTLDDEKNLSSFADMVKNEKIFIDGKPYNFTTARKFKGLEAEVIIVVDLDNNIILDDENRLLFYVGSSRAKFELGLIFNVSFDDCKNLLNKYACKLPLFKNSFSSFYAFFGAVSGE